MPGWALLTVLVAAAAVSAPPALATVPGQNGLIVTYRFPSLAPSTAAPALGSGIYAVDPARPGADPRPLRLETQTLRLDTPRWSPDGTRIAYTAWRQVNSQWRPDIEIANADGTGVFRVTDTGEAQGPVWSPDGNMIAFSDWSHADPSELEMYFNPTTRIVFVSGSGVRRFTHGEVVDWSPDCSRVTLVRRGGRGMELTTLAADGSVRVLSDPQHNEQTPTWSPDGQRLAFVRYERRLEGPSYPSRNQLYTIAADGSGRTPLWLVNQQPAWSPDGTRLAFVGDGVDIWARDLAGGTAQRLTDDGPAFFTVQPDWQPVNGRTAAAEQCDPWRTFESPRGEGPFPSMSGPALKPPSPSSPSAGQTLPAPATPLAITVRPRRVRAGRATRFVFRVTEQRRPVHAATVRFAGRRVTTRPDGRAAMRVRFRRRGLRRVIASKPGFRPDSAAVRVLRRR